MAIIRYKVAVIGAGPIGIEMAIALKQRGIDYVHLEAGQIGATISWYAPDTTFFSSPERLEIGGVPLEIPAQRKATREEYLSYLRSLVKQFDLTISTYQRVVAIQKQSDGSFLLTSIQSPHGVGGPEEETYVPNETSSPSYVIADKLIVAIGDLHRANKLDIPGEELPHVSHYLREPHYYFKQRVLIVGGKNSAAEAALRLSKLGANITLSYRGAELDSTRIKYWIYPELLYLIRQRKINFLSSTTLTKITSQGATLVTANGDTISIAADKILLLTGYRQTSALYEQLGIDLEGVARKPIYDVNTMMTSVPGVYVAGTGVAGTQMGGVTEFIETSHVHVVRVMADITGYALAPSHALREMCDRET